MKTTRAGEASPGKKTVWGIAELWQWTWNMQKNTGRNAEDCLQAHLDVGIRHVIWDIGRSRIYYHSQLPNTTLFDGDSRPESKVVAEVLRQRCSLRTALAFAKEKGITIYAHLGMNRHYGTKQYGGGLTSRFAAEHPEFHCVTKDGSFDSSRLSYFFPEHRQERMDILCEAARIGAHGLCLDFCRQVPMMGYEPKLVEVYMAKGNPDPRKLDVADPKFMEWCRFRCEYVTGFMRDLRRALGAMEKETGRKVPVMARVTDAGFGVNVMEGTDVETWVKERLIDELCTDPLWWLQYKYPDTIKPYADLSHANNIPFWGGLTVNQAEKTKPNPVSFLRRVKQQYDDGADGVAVFQSDAIGISPMWPPLLPKLADPAAVSSLLADSALLAKYPQDEASRYFSVDNHSKIEALGVAASPMSVL